MQKTFKIGQLSKATGCQVETIRFYEQEGLLPAPARNAGNYRLYDCSRRAVAVYPPLSIS
jgi:DNA-binding transcriptional MerR regulator